MSSHPIAHIHLDPSKPISPLRDAHPQHRAHEHKHLPHPTALKVHPGGKSTGTENARLYFVGTATTILEWEGVRIMTDPNFLHAGDHVHLGPGVTGTRLTNPSIDLHDLPRIDLVLLSHYHADHFDQHVEASLNRALPILTTPHAHTALTTKSPEEDNFTAVTALDTWQSALLHITPPSQSSSAPVGNPDAENRGPPLIKVTAMPGHHVPPLLAKVNELAGAVPPTNGWMVELGRGREEEVKEVGYRMYITGDTLYVDELKSIPERYPDVDLMVVHLGGTTIPSPSLPLLMVTMDAKQGIQLVHLINPDVTLPVHYDDYDVFLSPLTDFQEAMASAGLGEKVAYLDRGDAYAFSVRG
ncbi:Metallo-hydrolase/oxidoreductase [Heliocybe sulcata]|uniref:Metallo-hydrolase/oxidoreductase n=1 Tax=Heliocybe sulcata TaxID=5364 RepID=A0A5C3N4H9_9AGAM|nr:Metallo-hydrolase/oxidoreductase [Heliocybe sulcata]